MISESLEFAEKSEFSGEKPQKFEKRKKLGVGISATGVALGLVRGKG
jgi:hypothetical protein